MGLQVELVSPERILFSGEAEMVIARTVGGGDIAFLDGHAPFVGALEVATATITAGGGDERVAVHGGFIEVTSEPGGAGASEGGPEGAGRAGGRTLVTILSDVAEMGGEIDVLRAQQAKERAQATLHDSGEVGAEAALRRANVRLAAAGVA
jgi:F-type H+-transporting ATPase subunit epsilon